MSPEKTQSETAFGGVEAGFEEPGTILVPLDGSPAAAAMLPIARASAQLLGVPIHLLHVVTDHLPMEELLRRAGLQASDVAGMVLEQAEGDPAEAILHEVAQHRSRLIVLSAQGWAAAPNRVLGHVAEQVLRQATCSILMVRTQVAQRFTAESHVLARILIPLDGTPTTAAVMAPAAEIAARSGALLDVLHVATAGEPETETGTMTVPMYQDNPQHEWHAWRQEFADRFMRVFDGKPASVNVAAGDPAREILRMARARRSDLIVLAWKGDLTDDRARTVRAILRHAPCPLLFLRTRPSLGLPDGSVQVSASPLAARPEAP